MFFENLDSFFFTQKSFGVFVIHFFGYLDDLIYFIVEFMNMAASILKPDHEKDPDKHDKHRQSIEYWFLFIFDAKWVFLKTWLGDFGCRHYDFII